MRFKNAYAGAEVSNLGSVSKVVARGINDLATAEGGDGVRRAMTQPLERQIDQRLVVRLQRDAQIELQNAIAPREGPVHSARQDLAAQPRTIEGAARDWRYDACSMGHRAELLWRPDDDLKRHQQA